MSFKTGTKGPGQPRTLRTIAEGHVNTDNLAPEQAAPAFDYVDVAHAPAVHSPRPATPSAFKLTK